MDELEANLDNNLRELVKRNVNFEALETVYLGGGTPSLWGDRGVKYLENFLKKYRVQISNLKEVTLEVDPDAWESENLERWLSAGVNRFSVGAQAYNKHYLKVLDRHHSVPEIDKTLDFFAKRDLNFSVDILIGAPKIDGLERDIYKELDGFLKFAPSHFSIYILQARASYLHRDKLPSDEEIEREYLGVNEYLARFGYEQYEVSNFSRKNKQSLHNLSYWQLDNIVAIGPNATGFYTVPGNDDESSESKAYRYQVKAKSNTFGFESLTDKEIRLEKVYLSLRTSSGLNLHHYFQENEIKSLKPELRKWEQRKRLKVYVSKSGEITIVLKSKGLIVLDTLMDTFFQHTSL